MQPFYLLPAIWRVPNSFCNSMEGGGGRVSLVLCSYPLWIPTPLPTTKASGTHPTEMLSCSERSHGNRNHFGPQGTPSDRLTIKHYFLSLSILRTCSSQPFPSPLNLLLPLPVLLVVPAIYTII